MSSGVSLRALRVLRGDSTGSFWTVLHFQRTGKRWHVYDLEPGGSRRRGRRPGVEAVPAQSRSATWVTVRARASALGTGSAARAGAGGLGSGPGAGLSPHPSGNGF